MLGAGRVVQRFESNTAPPTPAKQDHGQGAQECIQVGCEVLEKEISEPLCTALFAFRILFFIGWVFFLWGVLGWFGGFWLFFLGERVSVFGFSF